ncbi:MAG: UDP-N-acetylmuramoyl-L-alanyl-D-glutamate--2,6-diaminopimelate ligase [Phycisphaerales bacterium]|nr:UDP-N-acetylmuramoyl-L-alanyl-D-glutamate--2,6-diaminopimelate ligase [Phycisphaerales bacterium]
MNLDELLNGLDAALESVADRGVRICDITEDSRTAMPGSLFVARKGTKTDGHRFIADAVRAGAVAVLTDSPIDPALLAGLPARPAVAISADVAGSAARAAERFFGSPSRRMFLMGVTGTNGKTTIAHVTWKLLNAAGVRCGLIGTVWIDDGTEVAEAVMTTPPATEISQTLARMLESGCRAAAMETSSHSLDQRRVAGLSYRCAVFTNLTGDHLDYHGTMENYAAAKARLFEMLAPDATAVVNAEDPWCARMIRDCRARVLRCGVGDGADRATGLDCRAVGGEMSIEGTAARFAGPWGEIACTVPLVGRHNLMNLLQAIAVAHTAGVPRDAIAAAIPAIEAPPGRLERVTRPGARDDYAVFVDYAHTDDALVNVLSAVRPIVRSTGGRLRVVFGCGGDRDRTKRPRMGRVAAELADSFIVTSDNPRTEDPASIVKQVIEGVPGEARPRMHVDIERDRAIERAVNDADPGDVVVIAGKGHETYQLLPDGRGGIVRRDFDDRVHARRAMEARAAGRDGARAMSGGAAGQETMR